MLKVTGETPAHTEPDNIRPGPPPLEPRWPSGYVGAGIPAYAGTTDGPGRQGRVDRVDRTGTGLVVAFVGGDRVGEPWL